MLSWCLALVFKTPRLDFKLSQGHAGAMLNDNFLFIFFFVQSHAFHAKSGEKMCNKIICVQTEPTVKIITKMSLSHLMNFFLRNVFIPLGYGNGLLSPKSKTVHTLLCS